VQSALQLPIATVFTVSHLSTHPCQQACSTRTHSAEQASALALHAALKAFTKPLCSVEQALN